MKVFVKVAITSFVIHIYINTTFDLFCEKEKMYKSLINKKYLAVYATDNIIAL